MLNTKEIKDKAERSYKDFLRSVLKREAFFPYHIKGNKGNANMPLQDLYPALKHLIDNSKEKLGHGYSVTYKEVNTRHSGIITLPDAIFFENPTDYLRFLEKEQAFVAFRKAIDVTKKEVPALLHWIEDNALNCQKYADNWADIIAIVQYFIKNPKPNVYWRQLPLAIDVLAAESLQPIIGELLEYILSPSYFDLKETQFEPRFGLKYDEPLVRIQFLDEAITPLSISDDFTIPASNFSKWVNIPCEKVFFVTDKNVFLSFPKHPLSILVLLDTNFIFLHKIEWLQDKTCFFIGDITPKGFEQLSEMRGILRGLKSLMMDKATFDTYPQKQQFFKTEKINTFSPHLTAEEQAFYTFSVHSDSKNGLLQRDISYSYLEKTLSQL